MRLFASHAHRQPDDIETSRPTQLAILTPLTLGGAHGIASRLQASLIPGRNSWRVQWLGVNGQPVSAEGPVGGSAWSQPIADSAPTRDGATQVSAANATGASAPPGWLTSVPFGSGRAGLRSGRRVVGVPPRFPSASLVLCREDSGAWRDLAFAGERPEQEIGSVSLALAATHWLAAYLVNDGNGRSVCRVVQLPLSSISVASPNWRQLPPYPQAPGMAGMMVGQHDGVLIAAGGANFPDLRPWEGGKKKIHDEIYVLLPGQSAWSAAGRLPRARGYGATVSVPEGVLIAGGEDGETVFQDTILLRWNGEKVEITSGPSLPAPTTSAVAVVLNDSVYLSGGYCQGSPRVSQKSFWQLDRSAAAPKWQVLPSWPGPTRALAVTAAVGGAVYVISGIEVGSADGKETPGVYLNDAYRYRPGAAWEKLPDLPWSALAGASPAPVTESPARVFVLGGVDGRQAGKLPRDIALPDDIIYLDVESNQWRHWHERWPTPVVCIPAVKLGQEWIIPSGESMAGVRTTEVWAWQIRDAN